MKLSRQIFVQLFFIALTLLILFPALAFEQIKKGQTVVVACKKAVIHSQPTGLSSVIGEALFGKELKITALEGLFELPNSDFSSKSRLENQASVQQSGDSGVDKITPEQYTRASWIGVGDSRFISGSCVVSKALFESQSIERAKEKVKKLNIAKGKRNFSEDEEGELRAMRGAAGTAIAGRADFKLTDKHITAAQGAFNLEDLSAFRREGRLGEFR